jgi:hypothetical protein
VLQNREEKGRGREWRGDQTLILFLLAPQLTILNASQGKRRVEKGSQDTKMNGVSFQPLYPNSEGSPLLPSLSIFRAHLNRPYILAGIVCVTVFSSIILYRMTNNCNMLLGLFQV